MKYLVVILVLLSTSCTPEEAVTKGVGYFDMEDYISSLDSSDLIQSSVTKTVQLNGESETESMADYNISPELNMMKKYNINKPALSGKYSETTEGNKTVYEAKEEGLMTRTLVLEKDGDVITRIEIAGLQKSVLSVSKQTLIFVPGESFSLKSEDDNRYTKDITKEVLIEY